MASVLPLLLIGGAALVIVGSKKKGGTRTSLPAPGELVLPPTTPPPLTKKVKKSGSGYPGVTRARMQEIQTMLLSNGYDLGKWRADGRYGSATKSAVMAFQKDHMPNPEDWDGKPGPKTQAVLQRVEADRVSGQQEEAQKFPEEAEQIIDECDPLDASTWGSGNVCEWTGSRWVRATAKMSPTPKAKASPAPEPEPTPAPKPTGKAWSPYKPSTWPSKTFPIGDGRPWSWLPNNTLVRLPERDSWFYRIPSWYAFRGERFTSVHELPTKYYSELVNIIVPVSEGKTTSGMVSIFHNEAWMDKYWSVVSSIRNLASQYPGVGFKVTYTRISQGNTPYIRVEFREKGFMSDFYKTEKKESFNMNISTQHLVGSISASILEIF